MDLTYTSAEDAFRAEVREWSAANLPAEPLPSLDTPDGFAAHQARERRLHEARLSVVTWPKWSSRATYGHWPFGLFRTDPDSSRHRGLTYFLVPLNAEGVTVRGIRRLDDHPACRSTVAKWGISAPGAFRRLFAIGLRSPADLGPPE